VIAREPDGAERIVWQGHGVGQVKLPAKPAANYRLDLDY